MKVFILLLSLSGVFCYLPTGKDSYLFSMFLRDLANRINGKDIAEGDGVSYLDFTYGRPGLDVRSLGMQTDEQEQRQQQPQQAFPSLDYDANDGGVLSLHPSIRDQEFLQQSSLWGKQFVSGGAGEGNQLLRPEGVKNKQEVKTDSTLPAYCNPPNPCPVGYTEEQGCIMDFENSASYSRRYQAAQDCMCDSEHMFECPNTNNMVDDTLDMDDVDYNSFFQQPMKLGQGFAHKNLVAKKFHDKTSKATNPFLAGEKLPVAAKKGNHVLL